ncbi:hypothetical protein B0H17DRAFT_1133108 [Mycena rosella]|uniref:Uncharacterized protein n=1 Tax=Mycena rosella TaxID=1033263 RepID=A0AAD7DLH7_MYCRO|nr:hypothetical protein B0H17DRAFT_1133108 [Mycena rosella]
MLAYLERPLYKDFPGELYTVFGVVRVFDDDLQCNIDRLEIKAGYSTDTARCQLQYRASGRWSSNGTTKHLVHLTLRECGAALPPRPCPGCGVRHREFFSMSAAGGIEGLCGIIEFWSGTLGEAIDRVDIHAKHQKSLFLTAANDGR